MELTMEAWMAGFLDAAMVVLILQFIRRKKGGSACEKVLCVTMLFGFALGVVLGHVQHARTVLALCALGVILSYVAEGLAFAGNTREAISHE